MAWQKLCGGTGYDRATSIQQTSDGGYVVAGYTNSFGAGSYDYWVLKLNSDATVAWQKTYGGTSSDYASKIQQTSDGSYVVAGETQSFGATIEDFWILKLNPDGTVNWQKTYGAPNTQNPYSIQQTSNGGFIVAGRTLYLSVGSYDLWILKLNPDGSIPFNTSSGAIVIDTSATVNDSSITLTNTSTTITNTSATITNTSATINDTNATIQQQAP
ncbi:MAG: hypothetical protein PHE84_09910 [bacterium]|nr:hypothetical protein [bacterium]